MVGRIEDYAIIGNCETVALVGKDGSIDWLGLPRFDSAACFAALLGAPEHGRWQICPDNNGTEDSGPEESGYTVARRYRGASLILETVFETAEGAVCVIDCMTRRHGETDIIRRVRGLRGQVAMRMDLVVRFDYGNAVPWLTRLDDGRIMMVVGPDRLVLESGVEVDNANMRTAAAFVVGEGEEIDFTLTWTLSYRPMPGRIEVAKAITHIEEGWARWASGFRYEGPWREPVLRSLVTLKALTHWDTGGIVAAGTTSLPERIGGNRNWDYRYCWLRDATLTLYALMQCGFVGEASAWRDWLTRAIAGDPDQMQIMYGVAGERRLDEWEIPWLPGYETSAPVRIGNAASGQVQLDVFGEVIGALYFARQSGLPPDDAVWHLEVALIEHLERIWDQPDDGIWEVRGGRQHFTHSKVMAWVAIDRAIRSAEDFAMDAPLDHWRDLRARIHAAVCTYGFNPALNSFTQAYGSTHLDASLLMIPLLGFLPPEDERVVGTVAAIEKTLLHDGFVLRYETAGSEDGLPPGEGAFLACSFWLADTYVLMGRHDEARALFEHLLGLTNDVGLLAEEYDPHLKRQVGNFPQAFSHIALIGTALNLARAEGPAKHLSGQAEPVPGQPSSSAAA